MRMCQSKKQLAPSASQLNCNGRMQSIMTDDRHSFSSVFF